MVHSFVRKYELSRLSALYYKILEMGKSPPPPYVASHGNISPWRGLKGFLDSRAKINAVEDVVEEFR